MWRKGAKVDVGATQIRSVAEDLGISLRELTSERRDDTLKSFATRDGWYRAAEVDRLSAEEAEVIADRLVRRATLNAPTIAAKSEPLKVALVKVIREQLTGCSSTQCRQDCHQRLVEIARKNLNDQEFIALMEAEKRGYRPIGDEQ